MFDDAHQRSAFSEFINLIRNNINLIRSYKKLGENFDGFILGIKSNSANAILFFEDGFSEHLFKKQVSLKEKVASFDEFLKVCGIKK